MKKQKQPPPQPEATASAFELARGLIADPIEMPPSLEPPTELAYAKFFTPIEELQHRSRVEATGRTKLTLVSGGRFIRVDLHGHPEPFFANVDYVVSFG